MTTGGSRIRREVRALARHEGQGHPAGEVPRPIRAGRLSDPAHGGVPRLVDARRVRATDGGDAGASGFGTSRPQPGAVSGPRIRPTSRSIGKVACRSRRTCARSPSSTRRCWYTAPSTGSSCGIPRNGDRGCSQRRAGSSRTTERRQRQNRTATADDRIRTPDRREQRKEPQDRTQKHPRRHGAPWDAMDHVQLLDRRAGRPLHPLPHRSSGSPPPPRPTGRGAADGPLVRTHSRAARRGGGVVRSGSARRRR